MNFVHLMHFTGEQIRIIPHQAVGVGDLVIFGKVKEAHHLALLTAAHQAQNPLIEGIPCGHPAAGLKGRLSGAQLLDPAQALENALLDGPLLLSPRGLVSL